MKKTFKIQDVDCANCAAKIERNIAKIDGVDSVSLNFMTEKLVLEIEDSIFDEVFEKVVKAAKKVERDCSIS